MEWAHFFGCFELSNGITGVKAGVLRREVVGEDAEVLLAFGIYHERTVLVL